MNYLVTGGTGFLGSYLVKNLVDKKHDVTIVSTSIRDKTSLKTLKVNLDRVNLVKGDVRDFDFLRKLFNEYEFDYVYHLGAISEVRKCQSDAKLAYDVNVGGTINILECIRSYYSNFNIPVVVTRCSNLYGGGDANFSRLIPNTIKRLINGQSPIIWRGVKDSTREFIYVEDAVDAYISLMDNIDETKGQAYNIGGNVIKSIEEVVLMLIEKINSNIKVEYLEKDFPEITHQYLDSTKITNVTNWQPKIDFDTGINSTIDFYKKYYKND